MSRPFATVEDALEEIRAGRMVVVCDDEDRENEGDLTMAAQFATPEAINFMAKEGRGLICLALTPERCDELGLDLMAAKNESLRRTSLGAVAEGGTVNLELPLRATDRLGGHFVQGHVDGVATVRDTREDGFARVVTFDAPPELLRYIVEKGSIAVDGVSLTVSAVDEESFAVSLIPETLERTTLGTAEPGRPVNLEVDVLAKYVEKLAR